MEPHVRDLAARWGFVATEDLPPGHCCRAWADATRVLRVPFDGEEITHGVRAAIALQAADGPRIFASDEATGILLMERLLPGTKLAESPTPNPEVFLAVAPKVAAVPPPVGAMTLREYYGSEGRDPGGLLEGGEEVFLHGDLHHENVLWSGDRWRPIDAKGLVGDRAYEAAAFLRNEAPDVENDDALAALVVRLAEGLGTTPVRVAAWTLFDLEGFPEGSIRRMQAPRFDRLLRSWGHPARPVTPL